MQRKLFQSSVRNSSPVRKQRTGIAMTPMSGGGITPRGSRKLSSPVRNKNVKPYQIANSHQISRKGKQLNGNNTARNNYRDEGRLYTPVEGFRSGAILQCKERDIHEIKSYKYPPQQVKTVFQTLFLVRDRVKECDWEYTKKQISNKRFLQSVRDMDFNGHMDARTVKYLEKFFQSPDMSQESIMMVSKACGMIYSYLDISFRMFLGQKVYK